MGRRASLLVTALVIWGSLAQIAPKVFGIDTDRKTVVAWLFDPAITWVAGGVAVVWMLLFLNRIAGRLERMEKRTSPMPRPSAGELNFIGQTTDQRAIFEIGSRLVEFDGFAYEFYQGRPDDARTKVDRAVTASHKTKYSERDLRTILRDERPTDEPMIGVPWKGGRVRFLSRTEIREDPERDEMLRTNGAIRRFYAGGGMDEAKAVALLQAAVKDVESLTKLVRSGDLEHVDLRWVNEAKDFVGRVGNYSW